MAQLSIDNALWPRGYKKKNYIVPLKSKWSGKQDLNLQPLGPKPSALPS